MESMKTTGSANLENFRKTIDVVIPVYKPKRDFPRLLSMLAAQTIPVNRLILMNTEERYWPKEGYSEADGLNLELHHVTAAGFDHGGTRDEGIRYSKADYVLCMTDDAIPADDRLLERLLEGFQRLGPAGEKPAAVYGRQLPKAGCSYTERYTRSFNYPEETRVKTKSDLPLLGIKTYFCSNVCCMYDRAIYESLGGFTRKTIFNEDMIFAAGAIRAGYAVVYEAKARVLHSHNYGCVQQLKRNFDLGVSQADHPEVFLGLPSEGEGIRLVKKTAGYLLKTRRAFLIPELVIKSAFKYVGYRLGKCYRHLPRPMVMACTMNRAYFRRENL